MNVGNAVPEKFFRIQSRHVDVMNHQRLLLSVQIVKRNGHTRGKTDDAMTQ